MFAESVPGKCLAIKESFSGQHIDLRFARTWICVAPMSVHVVGRIETFENGVSLVVATTACPRVLEAGNGDPHSVADLFQHQSKTITDSCLARCPRFFFFAIWTYSTDSQAIDIRAHRSCRQKMLKPRQKMPSFLLDPLHPARALPMVAARTNPGTKPTQCGARYGATHTV